MYMTCGTLFCGLKHDMLNYAPCPPPMMEYSDFYNHALTQNLSHLETCNISRRCRLNETLTDQKCSIMTTTISSMNYSTDGFTSFKPTGSSRESTTTKTSTNYTVDSSTTLSPTGTDNQYTTTTSQTTTATTTAAATSECSDTCLIAIFSVLLLLCLVVILIV
jgi:cobalamin biosynthesis Mg chelatase CobN